MNEGTWRNRISYRSDLVARVAHLTGRKATDDEGAFEILWTILGEKKLLGSGHEGYIPGNRKAVCFQEVPLTALAENLLLDESLGIKDSYKGFGIRVNKVWFYSKGGRPVIYGDKDHLMKHLPEYDHWRIATINLNNHDAIVDFMHEREWRYRDDFEFAWEDIEVIVRSHTYYNRFVERCFDEKKTDLLRSIRGIIALDSVIS